MNHYLIRRVALMLPIILGVSLLVFGMLHLVPGDISDTLVRNAELSNTRVEREKIRAFFGLDRPLQEQFLSWEANVLRGDLGVSWQTNQPVLQRIVTGLPVTAELAILSTIVSVCIGIPIGILSAIRQDTLADYVGRVIAIAGLSVPNFFVAILLLLVPSLLFHYAPPFRYHDLLEDPLGNLHQMVFPTLAVGFALSGSLMRMTRSSLLEVLRQDYVRTAWSKGLGEPRVVAGHALKNALIPVVSIVGIHLTYAVGGAIIAEQVFSLPGVGRLVLEAIQYRDFPQLQGTVLFIAVGVVAINLLVDLSYAWLDPRIRYG